MSVHALLSWRRKERSRQIARQVRQTRVSRQARTPWFFLTALIILSGSSNSFAQDATPPTSSAEKPAPQLPPAYPLVLNTQQNCQNQANPDLPLMRIIPPGTFLMGSPEDETGHVSNEGPRRRVVIRKGFALGVCEITVGQFRRFAEEYVKSGGQLESETKGCNVWNSKEQNWQVDVSKNWRSPGYPQSDNHPVACVSFNDAQAYIAWLNQRTGQNYRLPSEAEWEYAARAGTTSAYWFGDNEDYKAQCQFANGADGSATKGEWWQQGWVAADCDDQNQFTAKVGSYQANAFGLYDTAGNLWEWVADCWHESYTNAPNNGQAWLENNNGDCDRRVLRGGSWSHFFPRYLRSAFRYRLTAGNTYYIVGFRVARDL